MTIRPRRVLIATAAALTLAGCGEAGPRDIAAAVIDDGARGAARPRIEHLPLTTLDATGRALVAQGLIAFDDDGRVRPALARRWIVTDDGRSIIFRVEGARWPDGRAVTADEVRRLLAARIAELRRKGWARDLDGLATIEAMTGQVVEIRLAAPRPHLLALLAQPELGVLSSRGGTGPFLPSPRSPASGPARYVPAAFLRPQEGSEPVADPPELPPAGRPAPTAIVDFREGRSDLLLGGRFQHLPMMAAANLDGRAVRTDPVAGLFGLMVVSRTGPLAEAELREALAMAIDRPRLLASFNLNGWQEAVTIVPEALPEWRTGARPGWTYADLPTRRITARARLAEWRQANGPIPELRVALPPGPGSRILFARLAADWRQIGVAARMVAPGSPADMQLVDRVADYDSPIWYLARLACGSAALCSEDADQLIDSALASPNPDEARELLGEAELTLLRFQNFIPLASPVRWWLLRPGLNGPAPNPRGVHDLSGLFDHTTSRR